MNDMDTVPDKPFEQGLLFFGNQHETVPMRLLQDPYLTPRAKFAWQLIKSRVREFQGGLFPSYETLGKLLSDKPYADATLSRKVITQTLLLLRLTRWLTLCETVRNNKGQIVGNVYLLHDEPVPVIDTIQLNDDYTRLLERCSRHKDAVVRGVALHLLDNLLTDTTQWQYLSHIDWMKARYQSYQTRIDVMPEESLREKQTALPLRHIQDDLLRSNKELGENSGELGKKSVKNQSSLMELSQNSPSSIKELRDNSLISGLVPLRNSVKSYSTSTLYINKYCTGKVDEIDWTGNNIALNEFEKTLVVKAMKGLDLGLCQAVLIEAQERIATNEVKNPQGYLYSLIQRAKQGDFKPYLSQLQNIPKNTPADAVRTSARDPIVRSQPEQKANTARGIELAEKMRLFKQQLFK